MTQAHKKKPPKVDPSVVRGFASVLAESLFVLLPLIVLTIVLLQKGRSVRDLFASPEWSFAGAVLLGQSVVKLVYAVHTARRVGYQGIETEWIAVIVAATIVLGLVPSLIVLSLTLTGETASTGLIKMQLGLFLLGLVVFLVLGSVAQSVVVEELQDAEALTKRHATEGE